MEMEQSSLAEKVKSLKNCRELDLKTNALEWALIKRKMAQQDEEDEDEGSKF